MFKKRIPTHLCAVLVGAVFGSLLWGMTSAQALSITPNAVSIGASDVGKSFKVGWSQDTGSGTPDLVANSVWTVLGFNGSNLTIGVSLTNNTADTASFHSAITAFGAGVTPNATGQFASGGTGSVFKNISAGNGPQQTFPGGYKNIDLCVSSAGCSGGSFQNGLHAGVTDIMSIVLVAAFGVDPSATLAFFPLKFQTSAGSFEPAGHVSVLPIPATLPMLAAALGGLGILGNRRRKSADSRAAG